MMVVYFLIATTYWNGTVTSVNAGTYSSTEQCEQAAVTLAKSMSVGSGKVDTACLKGVSQVMTM